MDKEVDVVISNEDETEVEDEVQFEGQQKKVFDILIERSTKHFKTK